MDYYLLTDMTAQIGYELAAAGAETFRTVATFAKEIGFVAALFGRSCGRRMC